MNRDFFCRLENMGIPIEQIKETVYLPIDCNQKEINQRLLDIYNKHGLSITLDVLYQQQVTSGFISHTMETVQVTHVYDDEFEVDFCAIFNSSRERRTEALKMAPPKEDSKYKMVNKGCLLCMDNINWQQKGQQKAFYWKSSVTGNEFNILTNPYPNFHKHFTIAGHTHRAQDLTHHQLFDMFHFLEQAEDYIIFFNGKHAGASIPGHFHMQSCKEILPIEHAKSKKVISSGKIRIDLLNYPAPVFKVQTSDLETMIKKGNRLINLWQNSDDKNIHSINLIATKRDNKYQLYIIPRDINKTKIAWTNCKPASVEMGGRIVWSHDEDKSIFNKIKNNQKVRVENLQLTGAQVIKRILSEISPPNDVINDFINKTNSV